MRWMSTRLGRWDTALKKVNSSSWAHAELVLWSNSKSSRDELVTYTRCSDLLIVSCVLFWPHIVIRSTRIVTRGGGLTSTSLVVVV